jgi:hypothetical protein
VKTIPEVKIDRIGVCQAFLDARGRGNYLEIGVARGVSFVPIRARRKWGVDPAHRLKPREVQRWRWRALLAGREERIFRMTSDDFFRERRRWLARRGVDVALLDGLHTHAQTLRDALNALEFLKPGGALVIHDCNPADADAAAPGESYDLIRANRPGWWGDWNGDVWKTIVHLRAQRADLETVVLDCDYGVGVVRRRAGGAGKTLPLSAEEVAAMTYADLERDRAELLGLRPAEGLGEMVG